MTAPRLLIVLVLSLAAVLLAPRFALCSAQEPSVEETFATVRELRAQGDFDRAIELLSGLISEHEQSEAVLRKAYNDLVFTYLSKRNATTDPVEQDALYADLVKNSEAALRRFPDLKASTTDYPADLNLIYDTRRALLFGRLEVTSTVDSSRVFLRPAGDGAEDAYQGITPLVIPYVPIGDYQLTVTCSGYTDRTVPLTVGPSAVVQREVTLSRERTKKWWLTRVVAPITVGAAAIVAVVLGTGEDTPTDTTQPLDEPPPPPAGQ